MSIPLSSKSCQHLLLFVPLRPKLMGLRWHLKAILICIYISSLGRPVFNYMIQVLIRLFIFFMFSYWVLCICCILGKNKAGHKKNTFLCTNCFYFLVWQIQPSQGNKDVLRVFHQNWPRETRCKNVRFYFSWILYYCMQRWSCFYYFHSHSKRSYSRLNTWASNFLVWGNWKFILIHINILIFIVIEVFFFL